MFNLKDFFINVVPTAVILLPLTGGIVKYLGDMGVKGRAQLASALGVGLVLGGLTSYFITLPADAAAWFATVLYGLTLGLATAGYYNMQKEAAEKAVKVHIAKVEEQLVIGAGDMDLPTRPAE